MYFVQLYDLISISLIFSKKKCIFFLNLDLFNKIYITYIYDTLIFRILLYKRNKFKKIWISVSNNNFGFLLYSCDTYLTIINVNRFFSY